MCPVNGVFQVILSYVLDQDEETTAVNADLKPFYRLFPPYSMGEGMLALARLDFEEYLTGRKGEVDPAQLSASPQTCVPVNLIIE